MKSRKNTVVKVVLMTISVFLFLYGVRVISLRIHPEGRRSSEDCFNELKTKLPKEKLIEIMRKKSITQSYCDFTDALN
ncbi:MAG: hypothetical protein JXA66_02955 [Oligoflexia bacterium]|nr:hypothetical protein [Oligoflexia bacterium]